MMANRGLSFLSTLFLGTIVATWLGSCGSATSNDQGVTFTLLGFFSSDDVEGASGCETPTGTLGVPSPLNVSDSDPAFGGIIIAAGLQNNLSQQFIRTDRAFITYYIPGASRQPPETSVPLNTIIFPSVNEGGSGFVSSLPPAFGGEGCSRSFASFDVVPPDINTWLNFNRTSLPELPFRMIATVSVTGVTSAGDRYTSNEMDFFVFYVPDVDINEPSADEEASTEEVDFEDEGDLVE